MGEKEQDTLLTAAKGLTEEMRALEALLFASEEVLTAQALKNLLPGSPDARAIRKMIQTINAELQRQRHPFEIVELAGGYQFRTVSYYQTHVRKLLKERTSKRLSLQALECLAIIAYKQPITKAEIEAIRGVISDGAMKTLLERHMVSIAGRSDKPGRPLLYGTSREFLEYFGINRVADLPRIEEFEAMAREKMESLSDDEMAMISSAPDESELYGEAMKELGGEETGPVENMATDRLPVSGAEEKAEENLIDNTEAGVMETNRPDMDNGTASS